MDLSPRKKAILAAIVKYHIETGEPVGSKQLTDLMKDAPSSATLRNEMSDLCEEGYLSQPHTSAGRVPTSKGYRFYVNHLMTEDDVPTQTKQIIDETLDKASADAASLPDVASKLLSKITGLPSLSATVADDTAFIRRVKLVSVGTRLLMIAVITSDGRSDTKLCRCSHPLPQKAMLLFEQIVRDNIEGKTLDMLTPGMMQNLLASAGFEALELVELFNLLFEMIRSIADSRLELRGESNLFSMLGEQQKAKRLLSFIERKDGMLSVLSAADRPLNIVFGNDTTYSELSPSAVIVARYGAGQNGIGRIGVIGPTRMSYDRIVPSVEYLAKRLSVLMNECLDDMEE